ncbi:phytase [Oceaniserpentilla sp. 4NH20-0058]|uniref:phytase n=1 Tax=Oceaniserpentilla sp. 4NH20-0058 TaxID=3127660 RepID=UPI003104A225
MKSTILFLIFSTIITSACSFLPEKMLSNSIVHQPLPLNGEHAIQLTTNQWLSYGPQTSFTLSDQQYNAIHTLSEKAEYMDTRKVDQQSVVFAINEAGQPSLIRVQNNRLNIKHGTGVLMPIEGLCLYQSENNPLQVFLLDEEHMAHQYYIKEGKKDFELKLLRHLPMPPGAESCAVHDATDQLFVSEEDIGVWVYSARAESEVKRAAIDLVAPYGNLSENSGPLAVIEDNLFMAEAGTGTIHQFKIKGFNIEPYSTQTLNEHMELDSLSAQRLGIDKIQFTAMNDADGKLVKWHIPFTDSARTHSNIKNVKPLVETQAVSSQGDAADDPAIWVHPKDNNKSLIVGTNKKRGLYAYNLAGQQTQELLVGRVNNVDIRQGFSLNGKPADIAAASQRDRNTITLFSIHPQTGFINAVNEIQTGLDGVYGLCMYKGLNDQVYVFINDSDGRFQQWHISDQKSGWQGELVREFSVETQPEGCTTDEQTQRLFIGEENASVWTLGAEPNAPTSMTMVSQVGVHLTADIEGMEIYTKGDEKWLIVSSQGNDSYVVFNAHAPYEFKGEFRISLNETLEIDGASETDGLTVSSVNFNATFPEGLLVVQDGRNFLPIENQNFKLVSWRDIKIALDL